MSRSAWSTLNVVASAVAAFRISTLLIVVLLLAAGLKGLGAAQLFGAIAVVLAAVNIFGGFIVTHRMLSMFKKKTPVKK